MPKEDTHIRVYYNQNYSLIPYSTSDNYRKFIGKIKEIFNIKKQFKCKVLCYTKNIELEEEMFDDFKDEPNDNIVEIEVTEENNEIITSEYEYDFIAEGNSKENPFNLTKENRSVELRIKHIGLTKFVPPKNAKIVFEQPDLKPEYDVLWTEPISPKETKTFKFQFYQSTLESLKGEITEFKLKISSQNKIQPEPRPIVIYVKYNSL